MVLLSRVIPVKSRRVRTTFFEAYEQTQRHVTRTFCQTYILGSSRMIQNVRTPLLCTNYAMNHLCWLQSEESKDKFHQAKFYERQNELIVPSMHSRTFIRTCVGNYHPILVVRHKAIASGHSWHALIISILYYYTSSII